jgi:membrane-bound serine protease (ClpP class)
MNDLLIAMAATFGGLFGAVALFVLGGERLTQSRAFSKIALSDTQQSKAGYTAAIFKESMIGKKGVAHTVLRPSGRVMINQQILDAFTRGEFIEKGTAIEVVSQEGSTLQVKQST